MRVICPGLLGSWEQFRGRFAVPIEKFGDDGRRRALAALLRPFLLRRTKAEVAPELPRAHRRRAQRAPVRRRSMALYEELRRVAARGDRADQVDAGAPTGRIALRAAGGADPPAPALLPPAPGLPDARTAGRRRRRTCCELADRPARGRPQGAGVQPVPQLPRAAARRACASTGFACLLLDGTTPAETREQRIAAFQAGEADVFLISLKAGGIGLNLTAADNVIHLDPWWNPAVEDQATARAHRIGQQRPVTAVPPGRARHDRGGGARAARRQARAGRRRARGRRAGRDARHRRAAGADPQGVRPGRRVTNCRAGLDRFSAAALRSDDFLDRAQVDRLDQVRVEAGVARLRRDRAPGRSR